MGMNPETVSNTLRPICTDDIFEEPVFSASGVCQNTFCRYCIEKRLPYMAPECLQSFLDEVLVKCEHSRGWTGRRDARPGHRTVCPVLRLESMLKKLDEYKHIV